MAATCAWATPGRGRVPGRASPASRCRPGIGRAAAVEAAEQAAGWLPGLRVGAAPGRAGPGEPDAGSRISNGTCIAARATRASRCARCPRRCSNATARDGRHDLDDDGRDRRTAREAPRKLTEAPVIRPAHAHVAILRSTLHAGARVGTVDKFQGQQVPILIYSMATSAARRNAAGMEFCTACTASTSPPRAPATLAAIVANPALLAPDCRIPEQMRLANPFCRFLELATGVPCVGRARSRPPPLQATSRPAIPPLGARPGVPRAGNIDSMGGWDGPATILMFSHPAGCTTPPVSRTDNSPFFTPKSRGPTRPRLQELP